MKKIKNCKGVETLIFAETFQYEAYDQIKALANFEAYQDSKIRVMPDAHAGKGCVIGTTMTITDKVTPNLVGVDIGCGMLVIALKDEEIDLKKLDEVIYNKVPCGFNVHAESKKKFDFSGLRCVKHVDLGRAMLSLGTLGGGNHFIEVAKDAAGCIFLIIHSGSRKLGGDTCKYYQDKAFKNCNEMGTIAQNLIKKLKSENRHKEIPAELKKIKKPRTDKALAYLTGSDFDDYMNDMAIVQNYATVNRETIAEVIIKEMGFKEINRFETIHNYIDFERMILRKGAVRAEKGELFIVPINMLDGSLLCIGKGNEDWNYSAPHGAGRLMSRSAAKKEIDLDVYIESMKGVYTTSAVQSTLDEAPQAYKSVEEIRSTIKPTASVVSTLTPIYNFKAH